MRSFWIFLVILLVIALLISVPELRHSTTNPEKTEDTPKKYTPLNYENVKAMWLSQYDLLPVYTDRGAQREEKDFCDRIDVILDNVSSMGINTVFLQVRPFADSFYPSEIYPVSSYVSGEYGKALSYDPVEIIISKAHAIGISVHAWINPLRAMTEENIKSISPSYKIREWYDDPNKNDKYVVCVSGRYYLNPAYREVRELVASGVSEITRLYDVDGVHIDDYFYPTTDEDFDADAYSKYKSAGGDKELDDFRRDNINSLVRELYSAVKARNEDMLFGISTAGNMKNNYNELYADVEVWCANEGYIDYLCPQLYFGFEHDTCAFDKLCHEFSEMIKLDGIKLIFGMSLGKAHSGYDQYAGSGRYEWRDRKDILYRQLEYTKTIANCSGVSYFSYQYFYDALSGERIGETALEVSRLLPVLKTITWS